MIKGSGRPVGRTPGQGGRGPGPALPLTGCVTGRNSLLLSGLHFLHLLNEGIGTTLAVQWLRLRASNAEGTGSIPGRGTKIPRATQCSKKKKKRG